MHPLRSLRLCEILPCRLVVLLPWKNRAKSALFFFWFSDFVIFFRPNRSWNGAKNEKKRRKIGLRLHMSWFFYRIIYWFTAETKIIQKKWKKIEKVLEGKEKVVPLHSQNNGDEGSGKSSEVVERSSLKEWSKQSLKGKCRKTLSILKIDPSQDRKQMKRDTNLQRRVWSWLRMNASGRPNTCKSDGKWPFGAMRVAHGCVTRMQPTQCWRIARRNPD